MLKTLSHVRISALLWKDDADSSNLATGYKLQHSTESLQRMEELKEKANPKRPAVHKKAKTFTWNDVHSMFRRPTTSPKELMFREYSEDTEEDQGV